MREVSTEEGEVHLRTRHVQQVGCVSMLASNARAAFLPFFQCVNIEEEEAQDEAAAVEVSGHQVAANSHGHGVPELVGESPHDRRQRCTFFLYPANKMRQQPDLQFRPSSRPHGALCARRIRLLDVSLLAS